MFKELAKVFGETVVYGLTSVAATFASILLVPFYTRVLTPEEFGVSILITTLFSIILVIVNLGMGQAVFRVYFQATPKERASVAGTSFISQTVFPFVFSAAIFLLSGLTSRVFFGDERWAHLVQLSAIALFFNAGIQVPLSLLRVEGRPRYYAAINIIRILATVVLSIILVVALRQGLVGVFWANLIGALLGYLMALASVVRRITLTFSTYWMVEMLRFGVPLVPAGLAMWVLNSSDKYFLNYYAGAAEVGIYNVGYKFGSLVTLVSKAISLATPRFVFSVFQEKPNARLYYKKLITYFFLLMFSGAFLISVFAKEATQIFVGSSFQEAYIVIPLVAFSYVADSLFDNFGIGISITGKTYLSALAVFISGVLNIIFNFVLISRYGMMGAAVATLLSFVTLALIELYFSQKVYHIPVEFKRMFTVLILGGILVALSTLIDLGFLASILVKSLIVIVFPISLFALGFFEQGEINGLRKIWEIVRSSRGRPKALLDSVRQTFLINDSVDSK